MASTPLLYLICLPSVFMTAPNHSAYQQLSEKNSKSKFLIRLSAYFKFDNCLVSETIQPEFKEALNLVQNTSTFKTIERFNQ